MASNLRSSRRRYLPTQGTNQRKKKRQHQHCNCNTSSRSTQPHNDQHFQDHNHTTNNDHHFHDEASFLVAWHVVGAIAMMLRKPPVTSCCAGGGSNNDTRLRLWRLRGGRGKTMSLLVELFPDCASHLSFSSSPSPFSQAGSDCPHAEPCPTGMTRTRPIKIRSPEI